MERTGDSLAISGKTNSVQNRRYRTIFARLCIDRLVVMLRSQTSFDHPAPNADFIRLKLCVFLRRTWTRKLLLLLRPHIVYEGRRFRELKPEAIPSPPRCERLIKYSHAATSRETGS